MLKKTKIIKEDVDVKEHNLKQPLVKTVQDYQGGKIEAPNQMCFLIKDEDTHATFYCLSFLDDVTGYKDVFIGSRVLDYTQVENRLIEIEEIHIDDLPKEIVLKFFEQIQDKPCYLMDDLIASGFTDFYSNGFDAANTTKHQETIMVNP